MQRLFVAILHRGAAYDTSSPLEAQRDWEPHRVFMTKLENEGFVLLGGPLEGTNDVLLIFRANSAKEISRRLAPDPWHEHDLLRIASIVPWNLRIGSLP